MEVQIVSRKLVAPSTPDKDHPRSMKLSLFDQFAPRLYVRSIVYYAKTGDKTDKVTRMERSLADTLSVFYPFAGRFNENDMSIDCNDHGAGFIEAKVSNCLLNDLLLGKPDTMLLSGLVPPPYQHSGEAPLVCVQVTVFDCGGIALGLSMSHVICDGYTIALFLNAWASCSRNTDGVVDRAYRPSFDLASIFPPRDTLTLQTDTLREGADRDGIVTRRLVFDGRAISRLRAMGSDKADAGSPSRVQVVAGLLWRAMMRAKGRVRPSLLLLSVNLRGRTKTLPILPNSCGNFFTRAVARFEPNGDSVELRELVGLARDAIGDVFAKASMVDGDGLKGMIENDWRRVMEASEGGIRDVYGVTSWCRMGHYDADFGWGRPSGTSCPRVPIDGLSGLMDARDGEGIEAWVNLDLRSMHNLQHDPDIMAFTSNIHGKVLQIKD